MAGQQELFGNNATTTVAASKTAPAALTTETWTVASGTAAGFPAASNAAAPVTQFRVVDPAAPSEVILVTNVTGTDNVTWSVTRGWESTTPVTHSSGFTVNQVITSDVMAMAVYDPVHLSVSPGGAIAETFPRYAVASQTLGSLLTGKPRMATVWLRQGTKVTSVGWATGNTASGTLTHYWVGLADNTGKQLAHSTDVTSGTLNADTLQTKALTAPFTTTYTGLYFILVCISSATMPTAMTTLNLAAITGAPAPWLASSSSTTQAAPGTDGTTSYGLASPPNEIPWMYLT